MSGYPQQPSIAGDIYNNQLFTKALLLNSSLKLKQYIHNSKDTSLLTRFADWENLKDQTDKLSKQNNPLLKKRIDSLEQRVNSIEKELSLKSETFATLTSKKRFTWQDIQHKLKSGEVAIEIIQVQKFGVTKTIPDSSEAKHTRYPYSGWTDTIYYAALILKPKSKYPELVLLNWKLNTSIITKMPYVGRRQDKVWEAIFKKLDKKTKKVYLSPDGVYNSLNFNTLFNSQTGKYLTDEIKIKLVYSPIPKTCWLFTKKSRMKKMSLICSAILIMN